MLIVAVVLHHISSELFNSVKSKKIRLLEFLSVGLKYLNFCFTD